MSRPSLLLCLLLLACPVIKPKAPPAFASIAVNVLGVFERVGNARQPMRVVSTCTARYGGSQAAVPAEARGAPDCRYVVPRGVVEYDIEATAKDMNGADLPGITSTLSAKVIPGDLVGSYPTRTLAIVDGKGTGTILAFHQYGQARVWLEDVPVKPLFDAGMLVQLELPMEPASRSFAIGASKPIWFEDQSLQSLQVPDGFDNRSSSFVGEFVLVGKNVDGGQGLLASCADDPARDSKPATMVVTGLDPTGFFVTDISACRLKEPIQDGRATPLEPPERCLVTVGGNEVPIESADAGPMAMGRCAISKKSCAVSSGCDSYLPGTYASMFVFNFSFPDGLFPGDLLFTLGGSVQEFTSTTQLTFPSWTIAERVRQSPPDQWTKWLRQVPIPDISTRTCGMDNAFNPFLTDQLCGHNRRNLKMESLESALVKVRRVKMPKVFKSCDFNGDNRLPNYCESPNPWDWRACGDTESPSERAERECVIACATARGEFTGTICSESSGFVGFGQYLMELNPPGPAWAGLDDSLPARTQKYDLRVTATDAGPAEPRSSTSAALGPGQRFVVACDTAAFVAKGDDTVVATTSSQRLEAREVGEVQLTAQESALAFLSAGATGSCWVSQHPQARMLLITRDAVPELNPDCNERDADAERARQCRFLRGATFDITGHLRHVQAARPRWALLPRDPDDVCCVPGPGMECPRPIQPCRK
jgi:hypothetical protein